MRLVAGEDIPAEDVFVDEASAAVVRSGNATPHIKPQPVLTFETPAYVACVSRCSVSVAVVRKH